MLYCALKCAAPTAGQSQGRPAREVPIASEARERQTHPPPDPNWVHEWVAPVTHSCTQLQCFDSVDIFPTYAQLATSYPRISRPISTWRCSSVSILIAFTMASHSSRASALRRGPRLWLLAPTNQFSLHASSSHPAQDQRQERKALNGCVLESDVQAQQAQREQEETYDCQHMRQNPGGGSESFSAWQG
jgi:hypothetical protein